MVENKTSQNRKIYDKKISCYPRSGDNNGKIFVKPRFHGFFGTERE
jgi:hypothetical protein